MVFLFVNTALCTVEVVETCKVTAEACVIVIGNFVVELVLSLIVVEVLEVRTANEIGRECMYLNYRIIH